MTEHHLAQLEAALCKTLEGDVTPNEFALIASISSHSEIHSFDAYLTKGVGIVSSWLVTEEEPVMLLIMPDDLLSIVTAYYSRRDELGVSEGFYELLELNVLE